MLRRTNIAIGLTSPRLWSWAEELGQTQLGAHGVANARVTKSTQYTIVVMLHAAATEALLGRSAAAGSRDSVSERPPRLPASPIHPPLHPTLRAATPRFTRIYRASSPHRRPPPPPTATARQPIIFISFSHHFNIIFSLFFDHFTIIFITFLYYF